MNQRIREYEPAIFKIAARLAGTTVAQQVGAECADLAQEGRINVWQTLERGVTPSAEMMENRMWDYIRLLGTQVGRGRDPVPYEVMLPIDDFRTDPRNAPFPDAAELP